MHDDELWQLYGEDGQPLKGRGIVAESVHGPDVSFGLALVWLWRINDGVPQVCLQKRAMTKPRWPGMYSTSTGGHINVGETPQQAVLRESREEIGAELDISRLCFIGAFRVPGEPQNIRFVFDYQVHGEVDFHFDDGEVDSMKWMSLDQLVTRLGSPDSDIVMTHYGQAYITFMLEHLHRQIEKALAREV